MSRVRRPGYLSFLLRLVYQSLNLHRGLCQEPFCRGKRPLSWADWWFIYSSALLFSREGQPGVCRVCAPSCQALYCSSRAERERWPDTFPPPRGTDLFNSGEKQKPTPAFLLSSHFLPQMLGANSSERTCLRAP